VQGKFYQCAGCQVLARYTGGRTLGRIYIDISSKGVSKEFKLIIELKPTCPQVSCSSFHTHIDHLGPFQNSTFCMTGLAGIFAELGISQYLQDFIDQGFDTWETILDIKESDFDALNVKLGHRRKLQRKIANARGISIDRALESSVQTGNDGSEDVKVVLSKGEGREHGSNTGNAQGAKRKYRRHPKTDENAPERPPSAYVIFSNKMREDLKGRNLSFTEIAKLVGEHWQNLNPYEKEPFESHAATAKERYLGELTEYKKTDHYREYSSYLVEFKARQQNQNAGKFCQKACCYHILQF